VNLDEYGPHAYLLVYIAKPLSNDATHASQKNKRPTSQKKTNSQEVLFKKCFNYFASKLVKDGTVMENDISSWLQILIENSITSSWSFVRLTEKDFGEMKFAIGQRKVLVKIQKKFLALQRAQAKAQEEADAADQLSNTNVMPKSTSTDPNTPTKNVQEARSRQGSKVNSGQTLVKPTNSPTSSGSPQDRARSIMGSLKFILNKFRAGLIEREQHCSLMLLSLLCGEHSLLLGPPGVAKSQLCARITSLISKDEKMFQRLLTKFTLPEELFGPLSIQDLKLDRHHRITSGYLPEARVAFLDEIFKANSAILNSMLTILNERKFDNGTSRKDIPLLIAVAASNEYPANTGELQALYDRFLFRMWVDPVTSFAGFRELIDPLNVITSKSLDLLHT